MDKISKEEVDIINNLYKNSLSNPVIRLKMRILIRKCTQDSCSNTPDSQKQNILILKGVKNDI